MSLLKIPTKQLVGLLADLILTSADEGHPNAGVLLHSARGYADPSEPGQGDLLVGTSTTGFHCGHTWASAIGRLPVMLWRLGDAQVVLDTFKKKSRGIKEHAVDIRRDGDHVIVAEDPQLFGETSVSFQTLPLDDYPRDLWRVLDGHHRLALDTDPMPRTDLGARALTVLGKVAKRHGYPIELYRYHQRRAVLVQIGPRYRGAVWPQRWDADVAPSAGEAPSTDLYPPAMPALVGA